MFGFIEPTQDCGSGGCAHTTSHALLYSTTALGSLAFDIAPTNVEYFYQFTGILALVTGFGFTGGACFVHQRTKQRPPIDKRIIFLVFFIHFLEGVLGIFLLFKANIQEHVLIPALIAAIVYLSLVGIGFVSRPYTNRKPPE